MREGISRGAGAVARARTIVFAALVAVAVGACGSPAGERAVLGATAPEYSATTLAGDSVALADLRGQAVLLNVWATWCVPCREEMPALQSLQDEYGARGLEVVGVSIDQASARPQVRAFLDEHAIDFRIWHDPAGRVTRVFGTRGVPETFLIAPDGTVAARWIGQVETAALRPAIREALP